MFTEPVYGFLIDLLSVNFIIFLPTLGEIYNLNSLIDVYPNLLRNSLKYFGIKGTVLLNKVIE